MKYGHSETEEKHKGRGSKSGETIWWENVTLQCNLNMNVLLIKHVGNNKVNNKTKNRDIYFNDIKTSLFGTI